jgi:hypothetical protein
MHKLNLNLGTKVVTINGDPERTIEFNPKDMIFVEKFYQTFSEVQEKQSELIAKADALGTDLDENGLPVNVQEQLALMNETCSYMRDKIDYLFGEGTSQKAFGSVMNLEAIAQFFEGILPLVIEDRSEKVAKYTRKKTTKAME